MVVHIRRANFKAGPVQLAAVHNEAHALEDKEFHARLCLADAQRLPMPPECQRVQDSLHMYSSICDTHVRHVAMQKLTVLTAKLVSQLNSMLLKHCNCAANTRSTKLWCFR